MGGACMGASDVDLFTSTAGWFGVGEVCDENYSFTCQHWQERWEKNIFEKKPPKIYMPVRPVVLSTFMSVPKKKNTFNF